jgi:hypothetical protein
MTLQELNAVHSAVPFRPFTIRVVDGRSFRITHRDYISASPVGRTVITYGTDGSFSILDLLLVTELSVEAPPTEKSPDEAGLVA